MDKQLKSAKPVFQKCVNFTRPQEVQAMGFYPYFRPISSAPAHSVVIEGKEQIMIGSNNYLGLTTHPKVKEAAIEAVKKYGSGCTGSRFLNGTPCGVPEQGCRPCLFDRIPGESRRDIMPHRQAGHHPD